ncbi:molybdenum cofactor guanylyltransferase [Lichenicola cladoniae]|uniref:Molybdenum cofactor guanylyltransferase n=1 Tax=Lichenicola cladoniae TaxID=1484109 RepID=A0A6M8HNT1_9PROT|nr:molybdenum cofactor guanylyltransferase [Lichenicola cladoniae]NPD68415.1 molybdenum cofactor guanylyltransferase [Acetobacteraceae bacterium]QKE90099.1 molybdenum cofactor guanylyltransferase [Lichenicola cladoniae]
MIDAVAMVLAGGEARRLGGIDKPLIEIGGTPILLHILDRLRPVVSHVALSANGDPARFARFGLPVLEDRRIGIGPLAGLLRGLDWAAGLGAGLLLTVPGDTPFIPDDLLRALSPAPSVAVSDRRHHLVALWPVAWRDRLARHLDGLDPSDGRRAYGVLAFAGPLGMREVRFASEPLDPFFNVNTQEDRDRADLMFSARMSGPGPRPG